MPHMAWHGPGSLRAPGVSGASADLSRRQTRAQVVWGGLIGMGGNHNDGELGVSSIRSDAPYGLIAGHALHRVVHQNQRHVRRRRTRQVQPQ